MTINIWLRDAAEQLAMVGIPSALLDAEIILAHTLKKSRTYLHAHGDEVIPLRLEEIANARIDLRLDRTPVAYIVGHKEFYGRLFKVTPSVLIPRPESETMIELLNKYLTPGEKRLVDIGTGSGCLGITAKLEHPEISVILSDVDQKVLSVARENSERLGADVRVVQSDLFSVLPGRFDFVLANLPYVDRNWDRSPETNAEPELALFADDGGLKIIKRLIAELPAKLSDKGIALIEADPEQHRAIRESAEEVGLAHKESTDYTVVLQKAS